MPGQNPVLLCQDMITILARDLTLASGSVIPAGTKVLLLPQTIADCILTPDGNSLADAWPAISREGHSHEEIVAFSEELTRYATRLAQVEAKLAELEAGK